MSKNVTEAAIALRRAEQDVTSATHSLKVAEDHLAQMEHAFRSAVDAEIEYRLDGLEDA